MNPQNPVSGETCSFINYHNLRSGNSPDLACVIAALYVGFWHETDVAVAGVDVCFVG
jgi:hypothetical protein